MPLIQDIQQWASGNLPVNGRLYIGNYDENPVANPIIVYTDPDYTDQIATPVSLNSDGRPVNDSGTEINLYIDGSYSLQIQDQYGADYFATYKQVQALDFDISGNLFSDVIQPINPGTDTSVGVSGNPYEFGYFDNIQLTNDPLITDLNYAATVNFVLSVIPTGLVDSVNSGTNIDVDNTDPDNPIVNLPASITGQTVNGVTLDNTGAATSFLDQTGNYSVPAGGGQVNTVNSGTNTTVNNTDPVNPIVNLNASITGMTVNGVVLSNGGAATAYLDETGNYSTPASGGQVDSVNTGTNITIDNTDPVNPIVNLNAAVTGTSVNGVTLSAAGTTDNFLAQDGSYIDLQTPIDSKLPINTEVTTVATNTYTLSDSDNGKLLVFTFAGAVTLTINTGLGGGDSVGFNCFIETADAATDITFAGTATLVNFVSGTPSGIDVGDGATASVFSSVNNRFNIVGNVV